MCWKFISLCTICFVVAFFAGYSQRPSYGLTPYKHIIATEAKAFSLDEKFIQAVIMTESGGDVKVVSNKGAMGLMQILPSTAEQLSRELGIPYQKPEDLFQADINIRCGCAYLYKLMVRFRGDIHLTLAAFNTGPARVERWLNELGHMSPEKIIQNKASKETKNYVRLVLYRYKNL